VNVRVRFAPSPTGLLHIGGARTALFNWLFARHHGGAFLLRIEDTDRARSTPEATAAILDGLRWLGLDWDEPEVYQSANLERHRAVALGLVEAGKAYRCYATPEELEVMRNEAMAAGRPVAYDRRWRDKTPADWPSGKPYTIRLRTPLEGEVSIDDAVQGNVNVSNSQIDDFVLLRSDGTPTYMLSVVVDDHDMGITHIIRGDDHLNNAFRQYHLFIACGFDVPIFAHIPLIHGSDGAKLSKRHGAVGVSSYRDEGFLPEALCNYLLRLGWGHGDDEIISLEQAISWFDSLSHISKSASRFDRDKLLFLNQHYLRQIDSERILSLIGQHIKDFKMNEYSLYSFRDLAAAFTERAHTLNEVAAAAQFLFTPLPLPIAADAAQHFDAAAQRRTAALLDTLDAAVSDENWNAAHLESTLKEAAKAQGVKLGALLMPLRVALTGQAHSPSVFAILAALGKKHSLVVARSTLNAALQKDSA
jgi:glutamyl-tRNA synthetase